MNSSMRNFENNKVGGGFLGIDEFLDQYTPAELEKIDRRDPLKKFSEKVVLQKARRVPFFQLKVVQR